MAIDRSRRTATDAGAVFLAAMLLYGAAFGHGSSGETNPAASPASPSHQEKSFGRTGDTNEVVRTIRIVGTDDMCYVPALIRVRKGETVRLVVRNAGKLLHELVLGTKAELDEHYALMKRFPEMAHHEPNMVRVQPGETAEIVWRFTEPGVVHFGCLIPGHWETGMGGRIDVQP